MLSLSLHSKTYNTKKTEKIIGIAAVCTVLDSPERNPNSFKAWNITSSIGSPSLTMISSLKNCTVTFSTASSALAFCSFHNSSSSF